MSAHTDSLISEVFKRPVLWDHRAKEYHNRDSVDKEWDKVAINVGVSKNLAKSKWKSLRDNFRKELTKLGKRRSGDGATPRTTRWVHFAALEFLRDVMEPKARTYIYRSMPKSTTGNIPEVTSEGMEDDQGTLISEQNSNDAETQSEEESLSRSFPSPHRNVHVFVPPPNPTPTAITQASVEPPPSKRKRQSSGSNFYQEMLDLEKRKIDWLLLEDDEKNDEDLHFFKSLIPYMKKLPPLKKLRVRSQIQNLIANELIDVENQSINYVLHPSPSSYTSDVSDACDNAASFANTIHQVN